MASPTQWTWVWANSRRQQRTGKTACCSPGGHKESDTTERLNEVTYSFWKLKIFNKSKIRVVLQTFLHQPFSSFIALMSRACFHMPTKISELVSSFCHLCPRPLSVLCFFMLHKVLTHTCAPRVPWLTASCSWNGALGQVGRISQQELLRLLSCSLHRGVSE